MAYEIDYLPVGEGERGGDAIALRFGNLAGLREEQTVIVIDGGTKDSGTALVEHIKLYYGGTDFVDFVISTHPDADHASGLCVVLEQMRVGTLVMHKPWEHAEDIKSLFVNGRITASGLEEKLEKSLQHASDLESLAKGKNITVVEPFQGVSGMNGMIHVLGPSMEYYQSLLPHFRGTPQPKDALGILGAIRKAAEDIVNSIRDSLDIDLLNDDEDTTSAENNTSTVILFNLDGHKMLFTGDAGKTALHNASNYAETSGIALTDLHFLDVPHHGSKRNLSSSLLKRIKAQVAYVSAPKESTKHPAKKVTNALKKIGASVYTTKGKAIRYSSADAPTRADWSPIQEEPFHEYVEE